MGLEFTDTLSTSYHTFHWFRLGLAWLAGIELYSMEGWGGNRPWDGLADPLAPLLRANGDQGGLSPEEARLSADRIFALLLTVPDGPNTEKIKNWGLAFAAEMTACSNRGEGFGWS